jgi:ATP synthase protein I
VKKRHYLGKLSRLWALQVLITLLIALIAELQSGNKAAISALLGGSIAILPQALFALIYFKYSGARAAKQIINGFYKGEALKIFLSVGLFALVFITYPIAPLAFFITYITVQLTHWLTPWVMVDNKQITK